MLYNKEWDKPTTPSQLLRKAADIMEQRGHAKGILQAKDGSVCANGALLVADGHSIPYLPGTDLSLVKSSQTLLMQEIRADAYNRYAYTHVPDWNNDPRRTGEEVIAKMREVADKHETVAA